jgi:hypothetical protein
MEFATAPLHFQQGKSFLDGKLNIGILNCLRSLIIIKRLLEIILYFFPLKHTYFNLEPHEKPLIEEIVDSENYAQRYEAEMDDIDELITTSYAPDRNEQKQGREQMREERREGGQKGEAETDEDVWMQPQQQYKVGFFKQRILK